MIPAHIRTITTASYEPVDTDQEFTLSELEYILYRLKDTAPEEDTVCYSMIKNTLLVIRNLFLRLINQSFTEEMVQIIPIPKKYKTPRHISLLTVFSKVIERLVITRVKWSAKVINPYSLGCRSGVGTIYAIATLIYTAAPMTSLRRRYKYRSFTYNLTTPGNIL